MHMDFVRLIVYLTIILFLVVLRPNLQDLKVVRSAEAESKNLESREAINLKGLQCNLDM